MLQETPLESDAIDYVKWCLFWSRRALSQFLLTLPLDGGRAFTFAPPGADITQLSRFKEGVIGKPGSYESLIALCLGYLDQSDHRYLVMEDVNIELGDRWLLSTPTQYVVHGVEVYHFVRGTDASDEAILQVVDNSKGYVTIGILTGRRDLPVLRGQERIDAVQLEILAAATEYIIVDAYDGEGFVIWTKE